MNTKIHKVIVMCTCPNSCIYIQNWSNYTFFIQNDMSCPTYIMEPHAQIWNNGSSCPRHKMTSRAENSTSWIIYIMGLSVTLPTLDTTRHISKIDLPPLRVGGSLGLLPSWSSMSLWSLKGKQLHISFFPQFYQLTNLKNTIRIQILKNSLHMRLQIVKGFPSFVTQASQQLLPTTIITINYWKKIKMHNINFFHVGKYFH